MKQKSRERLQRASGLIEGLSVSAGEKSTEKIMSALSLIEQVLYEEAEDEQKETPVFGTPVGAGDVLSRVG